MAKLTLTDLANLQNESTAVAAINANSAAIEIAMENTLSRNGASPNQMAATLDMNTNRIINLHDATSNQEPVTLSQVNSLVERLVGIDSLSGPIVSITDILYGAVGDGVTVNTTAIQTALNSGAEAVYVPTGTFLTGALTVPATVKWFFGPGTLKASGFVTSYTSLIAIDSSTKLLFEVGTIDVPIDTAVNKTLNAVAITNSNSVTVNGVKFIHGGRFPIYVADSNDCNILNNHIRFFYQSAIYAQDCSNLKIRFNNIYNYSSPEGHVITVGPSTTAQSYDNEISDNWIDGSNSFGIRMSYVTRGIIARNTIKNCLHEAITYAIGFDAQVIGNTIVNDIVSLTGTVTNASSTVTAVSSITGLIAGRQILGTGIPANTYIGTISATSFTLVRTNATYTGTTTNGSATVSGMSSVSGISTGWRVTGTGIPANTFVGTVGASSFTLVDSLSAPVTAASTHVDTAITFPMLATATNVGTTLRLSPSEDYGMSFQGDDLNTKTDKMLLKDNIVLNAGITGILVAQYCYRFSVENNTIIDCNQLNVTPDVNSFNANGFDVVDAAVGNGLHTFKDNRVENVGSTYMQYGLVNNGPGNFFTDNLFLKMSTGAYLNSNASSNILVNAGLTSGLPTGDLTFGRDIYARNATLTGQISSNVLATDINGGVGARSAAALSVIGRAANSTGVNADITGTAGQALKVNSGGTALAFASLVASDISNLGSGVATFLAAPSSANLATAVTNETGSGALVFGTNPTFTTGMTLAGSSSGTTTLNPTAAASGALTLPAATDTLVGKATTDILTNKTIASPTFTGTIAASGPFGAWTTFTPTATPQTGAYTTVTATGRYLVLGKTVLFQIIGANTTNGTGATSAAFTLPFTASQAGTAAAYNSTTNLTCNGQITSADFTRVYVFKYDGLYPWTSGDFLVVSGHFEIA